MAVAYQRFAADAPLVAKVVLDKDVPTPFLYKTSVRVVASLAMSLTIFAGSYVGSTVMFTLIPAAWFFHMIPGFTRSQIVPIRLVVAFLLGYVVSHPMLYLRIGILTG
jgi:hypothetical protein